MLDGLKVGSKTTLQFKIGREKTVPALYPESAEFQDFPEVFATGFMVGLMEWCCIRALKPALQPGEGSLGTLIEVTHEAPTPPGSVVTVEAVVEEVEGRRIVWRVKARDEIDVIGRGRIGRHVVTWGRFNDALAKKRNTISELA